MKFPHILWMRKNKKPCSTVFEQCAIMNEEQKEETMALEAILPPDEFSYNEDNFSGELRIAPRLNSDISVGIQGRPVKDSRRL